MNHPSWPQACEAAARDNEKVALAELHASQGSLKALEAAAKKAAAGAAAAEVRPCVK